MKLAVVDANAFWTEQLFRQCQRFADVLLLEPRDFRAHRNCYGTFRSDRTPRQTGTRVWTLSQSHPPGWMVELWPWSQTRLVKAIRTFAGVEPLALVITYPQYRSLIRALKPAVSIYYNLDDYRGHWPRYSANVPRWEVEAVQAADITVCIADQRARFLREEHPGKADRIHHLPLGCTPEFMASTILCPQESATDRLPVAGYIGALNFRFDFAFIADVAARLPHIQFILGGKVREDGDAVWREGLQRSREMKNIAFIGWVPHERLAEHLAYFDVLLMAYAHCNFNTNACPAKLWDYLGTGKPIVANDANPETLMWRDVVRIGATPSKFAREMQDAIAECDPERSRRRLAVAYEHTWEKLGERFERILSSARS